MSYSKRDWEKKIRKLAMNSSNVLVSKHAKQRMRQRNITMPMLFDVLTKGKINRESEPDINGGIKSRMERYTAGQDIAVEVVFEDEYDSNCVVVTALVIGGK